jgi:hypothetical protein
MKKKAGYENPTHAAETSPSGKFFQRSRCHLCRACREAIRNAAEQRDVLKPPPPVYSADIHQVGSHNCDRSAIHSIGGGSCHKQSRRRINSAAGAFCDIAISLYTSTVNIAICIRRRRLSCIGYTIAA